MSTRFPARDNGDEWASSSKEHNMSRTKTTRSQTMWSRLATFSTVVGAAILIAAVAMPGRAQAFADLKTALIDYSQADLAPRKACEALGKFKSKEMAQIAATAIPATADAP